MNVSGKKAIVFGGTSGIGLSAAKMLVDLGAEVELNPGGATLPKPGGGPCEDLETPEDPDKEGKSFKSIAATWEGRSL